MKKTFNIGCLATLALLFQPYIALTETKTQETASQQLEPIVVKGEQVVQRADLAPDSPTNLYRVEASARFGTEVFTETDIKNIHPRDVIDLIDKATGINSTYQGRRSPFGFEERGGGTFTYIIDGAVLPPSSNRILYKFPVAAIEEMQIVRGSTSLSLGPSIPIGASNSGSGLNTGFIIIRTKQPKKMEAVMTASMAKATGGQPWETNESIYFGSPLKGDSQVSGYVGGLAAKMDRPSLDTWFDGRSSENGMGNGGFAVGKLNVNMMAYRDSGTNEMQRGISTTGVLAPDKWYYDPLVTTIYRQRSSTCLKPCTHKRNIMRALPARLQVCGSTMRIPAVLGCAITPALATPLFRFADRCPTVLDSVLISALRTTNMTPPSKAGLPRWNKSFWMTT